MAKSSSSRLDNVPEDAPFVRHPYSRERLTFDTDGESMTHQSHADSCDVNKIIGRYERTGQLPLATRPPQYADVSGLQGDLTERINFAKDALAKSRAFAAEREAKLKADAKKAVDDANAKVLAASTSAAAPVIPPGGAPAAPSA